FFYRELSHCKIIQLNCFRLTLFLFLLFFLSLFLFFLGFLFSFCLFFLFLFFSLCSFFFFSLVYHSGNKSKSQEHGKTNKPTSFIKWFLLHNSFLLCYYNMIPLTILSNI